MGSGSWQWVVTISLWAVLSCLGPAYCVNWVHACGRSMKQGVPSLVVCQASIFVQLMYGLVQPAWGALKTLENQLVLELWICSWQRHWLLGRTTTTPWYCVNNVSTNVLKWQPRTCYCVNHMLISVEYHPYCKGQGLFHLFQGNINAIYTYYELVQICWNMSW